MLHFMLDAYETVEACTNDIMSVNSGLVKISAALGLNAVMPPFLVPYYYSAKFEDGGVSAFMFFEGGHITIHTFPYRACYFADIVAEDFFSTSAAEKEMLNVFNAKNVRTYSLDRRTMDQTPDPHVDTSVDFGPHYMISVQGVEMTMESIYRWLDGIAPRINMEAITRPYVIYSTVNDPQYISGILVVAQSHVAVHYSIAEKTAFIDIFSCSFLETSRIESVLKEAFGDNCKYKLYVRGSKHEYSYQDPYANIGVFKNWQKAKE